MMAMVSYRDYNIYKVDSISLITEEYVRAIEERTPDLTEVQQYIGGDISAYSELTTILIGINNLVNNGDMDGLKVFIEQHVESIDSSIEVAEYLKKLSDSTNSGDLMGIIENLKTKIDGQSKEITGLNTELKEYKGDNDKLQDRVNTLNKDVTRANRKIADLEEQLSNAGDSTVISSYRETSTSLIRCKTQHIIYFKEITYARYTNSLVLNMFDLLKTMFKDRVKLLIYDNKVGIPGIYKGLSILGTNEYLSNKAKIIRDTTKFVVSEPNPVFLDDILSSLSPQFDVVIIYDRMRQTPDLVTGNNVTKIFVINSASNYASIKDSIRIPPNSMIISNETNFPGAVKIGTIPEYNSATGSAKMSRYTRLPLAEGSSEKLMNTILTKARITMNGGA